MGNNTFAPQFNRVKGISEKRRLPRLGKIRLGVKKISSKGKEYPAEVDYFVCPPEVQKVFGEQPKELEIMFPINEVESIFPQSYTFYGSSKGVKCKGDGEHAMERENGDGKWIEKTCPCEKLDNGCSLSGHLMFMIPSVSVGGVFQLDTGSYNTTVDINSGLDYVSAMVGRFSMIPLILKRLPRVTYGAGSKQTHYCLQIELRIPLERLNEIRQDTNRVITTVQYALPPAEDENPVFDEGATVVQEEEEKTYGETGNEPDLPEHQVMPFEQFSKLKKAEMIQEIKRCEAAGLKFSTPAPLADHSIHELKLIYQAQLVKDESSRAAQMP